MQKIISMAMIHSKILFGDKSTVINVLLSVSDFFSVMVSFFLEINESADKIRNHNHTAHDPCSLSGNDNNKISYKAFCFI